MNEVRLYRIGSDPEFVFGQTKEFVTMVVPASDVVGGRELTAFIGTDGHPSTAELRPPPAHNIRRHLMDIGAALDMVDLVLKRQVKYPGLNMYAHPVIGSDPLGGHIHVSVFLNNLGAWCAQQANLMHNGSDFTFLDGRDAPNTADWSDRMREVITSYSQLAARREIFTSYTFGQVMSYLLRPFENWIQPWFSRAQRNGSYGGSDLDVRHTSSSKPKAPLFSEWAYYHFEYRIPSTWLTHPLLAYAYLSLTKLLMLNFTKVLPLALQAKLPPPNPNRGSYNDEWQAIFVTRLRALLALNPIITNDIKQLETAIQTCSEQREMWFTPGTPIQVDAWRKLL